LLLVDKPCGITSHDVVTAIRRASGERRVGHAGTLDPLATGLLPLVLGPATRLVRFLPSTPKVYRVTALLGLETTTGDADGEPLAVARPATTDPVALASALLSLTGEIDQVPPMFSAKKVAGRRLYVAARAGERIERPPIRVRVDEIRLLDRTDERLALEIRCSPGTYVRALVVDLGRRLGCGATVTELRRIASGSLAIEACAPLAELVDADSIRARLTPIDLIPLELDTVRLGEDEAIAFRSGQAVVLDEAAAGSSATVQVRTSCGRLLGVGEIHVEPTARTKLRPRLVLP
jgi:tRNA pseudouridine55 synthase